MSHHRPHSARARRPRLEALEARWVPAQFGVPWQHADHLTMSFVPDGTPIGAQRSDLFRMLDAHLPTAAWQREVLRAFQTWAVQAHVNVALKADGGQPLGVPGPDQGDPRFGDVRIGAAPMSPEVLSISVPHDPFLSGTWSGDVLLNDTVPFGAGVDPFPVLLHEAGHVLGLGHSPDPGSVLFAHLDNQRAGLAPPTSPPSGPSTAPGRATRSRATTATTASVPPPRSRPPRVSTGRRPCSSTRTSRRPTTAISSRRGRQTATAGRRPSGSRRRGSASWRRA
jgi:hypothetical protein